MSAWTSRDQTLGLDYAHDMREREREKKKKKKKSNTSVQPDEADEMLD